jgi:hypothetical protein
MICQHDVPDYTFCLECLPSDDDQYAISILYCPTCSREMTRERVRSKYASTARAPYPSPCNQCLQGRERELQMSTGAKALLKRLLG